MPVRMWNCCANGVEISNGVGDDRILWSGLKRQRSVHTYPLLVEGVRLERRPAYFLAVDAWQRTLVNGLPVISYLAELL